MSFVVAFGVAWLSSSQGSSIARKRNVLDMNFDDVELIGRKFETASFIQVFNLAGMRKCCLLYCHL
jgi:hypothetical protein